MGVRMVVDGPCEFCADWNSRKEIRDPVTNKLAGRTCDDCGNRIERRLGMDWNGFRSHTIHHYHPGEAEGKKLDEPIMRELCGDCYLKDFAAFYPGATLPVLMPIIELPQSQEVPIRGAACVEVAKHFPDVVEAMIRQSEVSADARHTLQPSNMPLSP